MSKVSLYVFVSEEEIDRPLSRALRDRAAALSFGEGGFAYADTARGEKPRFSRPKGAFFNVTHTKNLFLCAVSDGEVGLDAQWISETESAREKRVAARVLTDAEQRELAALSEEEYSREFTRLWTRHEASAKLTGAGFSSLLAQESLTEAVYTDLSPLFASLGIPVAATLATPDLPKLELVSLEED